MQGHLDDSLMKSGKPPLFTCYVSLCSVNVDCNVLSLVVVAYDFVLYCIDNSSSSCNPVSGARC